MKTRIAPTPSGYLHPGNALNFCLTWLFARKQGGQIMLRVDDLDALRVRPEYIEDVFRTLEWLGMDYDAGPEGPDDLQKNWSQNLRMDLYWEALEEVKEASGRVFACELSRRQIRKMTVDGQYPLEGRAQQVSAEAKEVALRMLTPEGQPMRIQDAWGESRSVDLFLEMRDFILRKKDGFPAYQLTSIVDDQLFEISDIIRGEDLLESTAAQIYLTRFLSKRSFLNSRFYFHPLLTKAGGDKLSKSEGAVSLKELREGGQPAARIFRLVAGVLQLPDREVDSLDQLLAQFEDQPRFKPDVMHDFF